MTRALIYCRISVSDPSVPKVSRQEADCRALADKQGYDVVGVYSDDGISASTGVERPAFERLLADLIAGKGDVLLATEEERLSRNLADKERLSLACLASGATWLTVRDGAVDPSEAAGEFLSTIRAAVGRHESKRKAERQKSANQHRRAAGERYMQGARVFGWADDKTTVEKAESDLIRQGVEMILNGATLYRVTMTWRESGIKPMRTSVWQSVAIKRILTRWSNAAVISFNDEPLEDGATGKWEPIISRQELESVRTILLNTKGAPRNKAKYIATGIATCACGVTLVGSGSNGKAFYLCSSQRAGTKEPGSKHAAILTRLLDEAIVDAICHVYLFQPEHENDDASDELAELHVKLAKIEAQKAEVYQDKLNGEIDKTLWTKTNVALSKQASDLQSAISRLANRSAHDALLVESRRKLLANSPKIMDPATDDQGQEVIIPKHGFHSVEDDIKAAFLALDLEEQRSLIRERLNIVVHPGRSKDRVKISRRVPASQSTT